MLNFQNVTSGCQKYIFLRHVIFAQRISVNPSKVEVVLQWERPKTVTEIRSFVGLAGIIGDL